MEGVTEVEELRAALAVRDADLAERDARIEKLEGRMSELEAELVKLRELVGRNSHKPPSSDPPGANRPKRKKGKRRRSGQKGHRGSYRVLLPPEQVDDIIDLYPTECESCWQLLPEIPDVLAKRDQLTELKRLCSPLPVLIGTSWSHRDRQMSETDEGISLRKALEQSRDRIGRALGEVVRGHRDRT